MGYLSVGFEVTDFSITGRTQDEVAKQLSEVGSVCVAGGNTYYLLHQAKKSSFDAVITKHVSNGLIYIGSSAGSLLAGPNIHTSLDDPKIVLELTDYTALGLTNISIRPHWGSALFRESYLQELADDSGFATQITTGVMKKEILVEFDSENS